MTLKKLQALQSRNRYGIPQRFMDVMMRDAEDRVIWRQVIRLLNKQFKEEERGL